MERNKSNFNMVGSSERWPSWGWIIYFRMWGGKYLVLGVDSSVADGEWHRLHGLSHGNSLFLVMPILPWPLELTIQRLAEEDGKKG